MNGVDLPVPAKSAAGEIEPPAVDGRAAGAPAGGSLPAAGTLPEADALAAAIRVFIHDAYLPAEPIEALGLELDLIENGILDSLAVVEVADFLEDQSGRAV